MFLLRDALRMIQDIRRTSRIVDIWGAALNVPQLIGGLIFIATLEGQLIFATLVFTLVVAGQIHKRQPFSRLIGLCHLPWLVLLPWIVCRLQSANHSAPMKLWGYYVAVTIAISLIFDVVDVYRYTQGQKKFSWGQ